MTRLRPAPSFTSLALSALLTSVGCQAIDEPARKEQSPPPVSSAPAEPLAVSRELPLTTVSLPDFSTVAEAVGPSVVAVISKIGDDEEGPRGIGSGMIISSRGEILTNEHVVANAREILVQLPDHSQVVAEVVAEDPLVDLALLQLRGEIAGLQPVEFRTRDPKPGEWIMAVGQPFGLGDTVTVGVVSGLGRDYGDVGRPPRLDPDGIWSFIQTDAAINIGNSGGPLVDLEGKVLGITTAVRQDGQGLAFAIPAAMAVTFIDEVRTHQRLRHTRLGITAKDALDEEGLASVVRVTEVDEDGPGASAGLQVGDLLLKLDGQRITKVSDVVYLTQLAGVGTKIPLEIRRKPAPPKAGPPGPEQPDAGKRRPQTRTLTIVPEITN